MKFPQSTTKERWYCTECEMVAVWAPKRQGVSCDCDDGFEYIEGWHSDIPKHWIKVEVITIIEKVEA